MERKLNKIKSNEKLTDKIKTNDHQNIQCKDCEFKCLRDIDLKLHMSFKHPAKTNDEPAYSSEYLAQLMKKYKNVC